MKHIRSYYKGPHMFSGSFFFGSLLLIGGSLMILNGLFGFDVPVARTLMALFFLYLGLQVLFGGWKGWGHFAHWEHCESCHTRTWDKANCSGFYSTRKGSSHIRITDDKIVGPRPQLCFETRKGQAIIDLSPLTEEALAKAEHPLEINTSTRAGQTIFTLKASIPFEIHATSSWGDAQFPDGSNVSYGSRSYRSHPNRAALIIIHADVRMGNVKFVAE